MPRFFNMIPLNHQDHRKAFQQLTNVACLGMAFHNWLNTPKANWFESGPSMFFHLLSIYNLQPNADSLDGLSSTLLNTFYLGSIVAGNTSDAAATALWQQLLRGSTALANAIEGLVGDHKRFSVTP